MAGAQDFSPSQTLLLAALLRLSAHEREVDAKVIKQEILRLQGTMKPGKEHPASAVGKALNNARRIAGPTTTSKELCALEENGYILVKDAPALHAPMTRMETGLCNLLRSGRKKRQHMHRLPLSSA